MSVTDLHPSLLPPKVTPERLARLEDWVMEYVTDVRDSWVEKGEPVDSEAGLAALVAVAESMRCTDIPEWMPLAQAAGVYKIELLLCPERVSPDRLRSALRTYKTATQDELDAHICNQMGWQQLQLDKFRGKHRAQEQAPAADGECAVYRYYDAADRLLYVGIAGNPNLRDEQHRNTSKWHRFQVRREVEWRPTKRAALDAERDAIRSESPVFNLTHASPAQKRAALDYLFDRINEVAS